MNTLVISLDESIFNPHSNRGDSIERFQAYSNFTDKFVVIVPTTNHSQPKLIGKLHIIPCFGTNKLLAYSKLPLLIASLDSKEHFDLVQSNDPVLGLFARIASLFGGHYALLVNSFGTRINQTSWIREKPHHFILWLATIIGLLTADGIRTDNSRDKKLLTKFLKIKPKKIAVIPVVPNDQTQQLFLNSSPDKKLIAKFGHQMILSVGSLTPNKDFASLLNAAKIVLPQFPKAHFVIIGSGPLKHNLIEQAQQLKMINSVTFIDSIIHQNLPCYFASSKLFVLPSSLEGLPRVLMEAALSSLPVITTDINGAEDLFTHSQTALIVPRKNSLALADAILTALQNYKSTKTMANKARDHAICYLNFDTHLKKQATFWNQLINNQ